MKKMIDYEESLRREIVTQRNTIASLRAELEALKPKPELTEMFFNTSMHEWNFYYTYYREMQDNLKLTFEAGKLVKAEII